METKSTSDKKIDDNKFIYGHRLHRHRIKSKTADINIKSTTNNRHRHGPRKCENIDIDLKISDIDTSLINHGKDVETKIPDTF